MTRSFTVDLLADTDELVSLVTWLREDPAVAPYVQPHSFSGLSSGSMGSTVDQIVVSLSASGTLAAFSACFTAWLRTRKSDVKVSITHETTTVTFEATNVSDVKTGLEKLLAE
jgi:hypothetical protein